MSAFVVSPDTMHRAVTALCARNAYRQIVEAVDGIATEDGGAETRIGRALYALNVTAVARRYPGASVLPSTLPARYRHHRTGASLPACLKALHCLIYQCAEGDIPQTPLFAELRAAAAAIAVHIVEQMPEYQSAAWD